MKMNENTRMIIGLYDGKRSSAEIAKIVGLTSRYVRKIAKKKNLDRLWCGAQPGESNHQFVSGRRIDLDGYVLVTAPDDHPNSRKRKDRHGGNVIFEHRLIMEQALGRYLLPEEVVDHIDGLTLHNNPSNLRLFDLNKSHLQVTITGLPKKISQSGRKNIQIKHLQLPDFQPVDTYGRRRKRGDVRLRGILLAALKLGIDSPFLLGSFHHLKKAGIDWNNRSRLEHALAELNQRWEQDLLR
jgi:hypothetical protein